MRVWPWWLVLIIRNGGVLDCWRLGWSEKFFFVRNIFFSRFWLGFIFVRIFFSKKWIGESRNECCLHAVFMFSFMYEWKRKNRHFDSIQMLKNIRQLPVWYSFVDHFIVLVIQTNLKWDHSSNSFSNYSRQFFLRIFFTNMTRRNYSHHE